MRLGKTVVRRHPRYDLAALKAFYTSFLYKKEKGWDLEGVGNSIACVERHDGVQKDHLASSFGTGYGTWNIGIRT
jgi:hypothetical protein